MTSRICPCCNIQLSLVRHASVDVDECPQCKGLWFEQGELADVQRETSDRVSMPSPHWRKDARAIKRNCCDCNEPLSLYLIDFYKGYTFSKSHEVNLDYCQQCSGLWVDHKEVEQASYSPTIHAALFKLNKDLNWKTRFFQFLTQLPVEYNLPVKKIPWVTYALILINISIFTYMYFNLEKVAPIFNNFALIPNTLVEGDNLWTLFSNMFLHGGIIHLLGNMYFLYVVGDNLEDVLSRGSYLAIYLLCGICGSLLHLLLNLDSTIPTIGASGAISGLFAMYLLWFRHARLTFMIVIFQWKISAQFFFLIWLAGNLAGLLFFDDSSIAYGAHIGGFACGLLIGYLLRPSILKKNPLIRVMASIS